MTLRGVGFGGTTLGFWTFTRLSHGLCVLIFSSVLVLAPLTGIAAVAPPAGVAPVYVPAGGFGIEGDLMSGMPLGAVGDWLLLNGPGGAVLDASGAPIDPVTTMHFQDPYGNSGSDMIFAGGLKWFDDPGTWSWTVSKASSKTDINNVALHFTPDADGHIWAIISADRLSTSGDSYIDFEFLQRPLTRNADGSFDSEGSDGGRTSNDLLLSLAFIGGGKVADFLALRWIPKGDGTFGYVDAANSLPQGRYFAALNSNDVAVPYGAFGTTIYPPNSFVEGAIDLTALLGSLNPCLPFQVKTIMVKTKASASDNASIEDFIDPIQVNLTIGPSASAGEDQFMCSEDGTALFSLQGHTTSGLYPILSNQWSVVSGDAVIESPDALATMVHVSSGTAVLRLSVYQEQGCIESDDVTLTIRPLPACQISGPTTDVCPGSTAQFSAPAGMASYEWSVSGNGTITGPANEETVSVVAGPGCHTPFTVSLIVTSNDCTSACSVDVMIDDTVPPILSIPEDLTLACPADTRPEATGIATAQDNCGAVLVEHFDTVTEQCGQTMTIQRTWTATDTCNNVTSAVQTIVVQDMTPPVLTIPANVTLECPADTQPQATGLATAQDICGSVIIEHFDEVTEECDQTRTILRTWTATDDCNNIASAVQTIIVRDTTPPVLTIPADATLECPADTQPLATGLATAEDTCGAVIIEHFDEVTEECGQTRTILRTWTATDDCNNISSAVQTLIVRDTTPPVLTLPADAMLECPADTRPEATGLATAEDTCGAVIIEHFDEVTEECGQTRTILRTWTATDDCNNVSSAVQTIIVRDTTPPVLTIPADAMLECPADTRPEATGLATAQDMCGAVIIEHIDEVTEECGQTRTILRTWTATDDCNNTSSAVQTIIVRDLTPPVLSIPTDVTLECSEDTEPDATGRATAADTCGAVTIEYTDAVTAACGQTMTILRTWTAADECNNISSEVQTIVVQDTTPPVLTVPADVTLELPADTRTQATGMASAQDVCGSVTVDYTDEVTYHCGQTRTIVRMWRATDECGNTSSGQQLIEVVDTRAPVITCPTIKVQCPDDVPAAYPDLTTFRAAGGKATDQGSTTLVFEFISETDLVGECPGTMTRTYRVTDECGNAAEGIQTIVVDDTTAPVIACPVDVSVECAEALDPALLGQPTASDNCDPDVTVTHSDAVVPSSYNIKFYAADPGENAGPYDPTYAKLAAGSLECPEAAQLSGRANDPLRNAVAYGPTSGELDALTSMGGAPMRLGQVAPFEVVIEMSGGPGPEQGTIEFTAHWSTHTTSNHEFGYDQNYMVYCAFVDAADPGILDPHYNARVESFDSQLVHEGTINEQIEGTFRVSGLDIGDRVVVEIWMVLDSNKPGNAGGTIASELVSAQKAIFPPEDISIGNQTVSIGNLAKILPLVETEEQPGPIPPTPQPPVPPGRIVQVLDRTWTAVDHCGNTSRCVQRITVRDATAPALVVPADRTLEYPADTRPEATGFATAQDGCSSASIEFSDALSTDCGPSLTILRTWTATDSSDNTTSAVQTITVLDTTAPLLTVPGDLVLECPADTRPEATGVAGAEDLNGPVTVAYVDVISDSCGNAGTIRRTWTATDLCGNTSSAIQVISVHDVTPPVITGVSDISIDPNQEWSFEDPVATDACSDAAIRMVAMTTELDMENVLVISRLWEASDACGNTSTFAEWITVGSVPAIRSTFNTSPEDWQVGGTNTAVPPDYIPSGGSAGGYVCTSNAVGQTSCSWMAPEDYLGDRLLFYGGVLAFALQQEAPAGEPGTVQVVLSGAGLTLVIELEPLSDTGWTTYAVRLQETDAWMNEALQRPATQAELISVLSDLDQLIIRVDGGSTGTLVGLDSVLMAPPMQTPQDNWLLHIQHAGPGYVELRWPILAIGCQLEASDSLITPNWQPVGTAPVVRDEFNVVEVAIKPTPTFYRLHRIEP